MPTVPAVRRGGLAALAFVAGTAAADLRFDTAFAAAGEPASLHFRADYITGGATHTLEVWRDHDRRVKRVTDGRMTTVAVHAPGDAEFNLTVIDPARRVITTIDRTNLYRLGNFTDWFDLTHGLRHPRGVYRLAAGSAPRGAPAAIARCAWFDLTSGTATTHVCWSGDDRLPLLIAAGDGPIVWRVTAVDRAPLAADVFKIADRGFVRVNANRDIDHD